MPDDEPVTAHITAAFAALAGWWDTSTDGWEQPVAARLVRLAGLAPPMRVLDIGAGAATLPAARVVAPGGHVTALGPAGPALTRAQRAAATAGLANVTVAHGDITAPPAGQDGYDALLASLIVWRLPGPAAVFQRWRTLLRPGGILAFSWMLADDPAWAHVYAAVDAFVPAGRDSQHGMSGHPPWDTIASAEALLAGYAAVITTTEQVTTRYASPQHWWQSSWTQVPALAWQHIPPPRRAAARAAAFAALHQLRAADGTLARVRTTCYTTARVMPPGIGRHDR